MASSRGSVLRRLVIKVAPFMFRTCEGGNFHWRWHDVCYCVVNENGHGIMVRRGEKWIDARNF